MPLATAPHPHRASASWPAWILLLPLAYLAHLAEEWWGGEGVAAWTAQALGREISLDRFVLLNAVAAPLAVGLTVAALRRPALAGFPVLFATVVVVNAGLHLLGSLATASYSPGLATGLALYLPVGGWSLAAGLRRLPAATYSRAVAGGLVIHLLVALVAFA